MNTANPAGAAGVAGLAQTLSAVPDDLRRLDRWVCWRREVRDGRPTKVPYNAATSVRASTTDTSDWHSFDAAVSAAEAGGFDGVGFVFKEGEGFCGVDLDDCIDEHGALAPDAAGLVAEFATYTEVSPSGKGLKLFLKGAKPAGAGSRKKGVLAGVREVEVYDGGRFFTVTGQQWPGTPTEVADGQEPLDALCARLWPPRATTRRAAATTAGGGTGGADPDDDRLLDRARRAKNGDKFSALFDRGDTSGHGADDSAADQALCNMLWFWTGDAERVDRLFRRSALYREKWEQRPDYRARTLAKAMEGDVMTPKSASGDQTPPNVPSAPAAASPDGEDPAGRAFALTDLGNAERLAALRRDRLRYCVSTRRWLEWNGGRWRSDDQGAAYRHAGEIIREMPVNAAKSGQYEALANVTTWSRSCERRQRLDAMVALGSTRSELIVRVDDLDTDQMLFNCENGTLDLRTGEIRAPRPEDLITKIARVRYDPDAKCPRFEQFLREVMQGDPELIAFLQRFLGMSLTGDVREQVFVMFKGEGGNGKSVLVDLMVNLMGEYAAMAPASLVVETGRSEHPTEIADLLGRRLVIASESNEDVNLREDQVKRLTGDRRLKGRLMRGDYFEFDRTHKLVSLVNRLPRVRENSHAMWRRICIVPFSVVIAEDKKDTGLLDALVVEGPGVLNWLIAGCLEWQAGGLAPPQAVQVATRAYRQREDALGQFLADRCDLESIAPGQRAEWFTPWRDIKAAYGAWCMSVGRPPEDDSVLQDALDRKGITTTTQRVHGVPTKGRVGIALRDPEAEERVTA